MARIAKSLDVLRSQINEKYPNRSKVSDGWIASSQHTAQNPTSDHEAWNGVVRALDLTHDLAHGFDSWKLADAILKAQDRRLRYVISNGRIGSGPRGPQPGVWRKYTGSNAHAHHVHVSVIGNDKSHTDADRALSDDPSPWDLGTGVAAPAPKPPKPRGVTEEMRARMMKVIMGYEGKIPPTVFFAPDGRPEIAGITQKDHPQQYARLKSLLDDGLTDKLMAEVIAYYDTYTDPAQNWTDRAGCEFFLRDCILNRGPRGAAEILQMSLGVEVDGEIGPTTRGALAALDPNTAIDKLRAGRERYEDKKYPQRRASGQWQGMLNRWNKAQAQAKAFQREQGTSGLDAAVTTGVIIVGTGTAAAVKEKSWTAVDIAMAGFIVGVAALVAFLIVRKIRRA